MIFFGHNFNFLNFSKLKSDFYYSQMAFFTDLKSIKSSFTKLTSEVVPREDIKSYFMMR